MFKKSQLETYQTSDVIHIILTGEFNASLSNQLLYQIRAYYDQASSICIHTDGITEFEPLGLILFRYNLSPVNCDLAKFVLTGKNASHLINVWPLPDCLPICQQEAEENTPACYF